MSVVVVLLDAGADTSFLYLKCGLCCASILAGVEANENAESRQVLMNLSGEGDCWRDVTRAEFRSQICVFFLP